MQTSEGGDRFGGAEIDDSSNKEPGSEERTVEEGDIYRVLGDRLILNLNAYRGLQVIDFTDVNQPRIIGRLRVTGTPVEMYLVGTRAVILLNNWQAYYGNRSDVQVDRYQGGLVLAVDISNPTEPVTTGQARVPGWIRTSRLTRGGGKEALFVAANDWSSTTTTVVRSFSVDAAGQIQERSAIDLGGYVMDIQATPQALLVARNEWLQSGNLCTVSVIDISDPDGFMVEGAAIPLAGTVQNKTNLDLYQNILRVASGAWWSNTRTNHLETFDVSNIHYPVTVDHKTFGEGEDLYATLFLRNRAFMVTYQRIDPFHAFEIDDAGHATERFEYLISGWNDFFKPVLGDTRIIGIGMNDQNGTTMAVSLYDITDLSNPNPFIARAEVAADHSWSEARWDDRAFSVLEDAVSVSAPSGSVETGLVLLPFSGYNQDRGTYVAAVQIFTFSESSLTRRGIMEHGTWVRRSFLANPFTTANLSEAELSLFDHTSPDNPKELGRVELAPNYTDFLVFGSYGARLKNDLDYYWWWGTSTKPPENQLQIIPLDQDPDTAEPVVTIPLPAYAQVYQLGSLALVVEMQWVEGTYEDPRYQTTIQVYDLQDPAHPLAQGSLTTDQIDPYYGWYQGGYLGREGDCFDCGGYYPNGGNAVYAVGESLVFPSTVWEQELLGTERVCDTYPVQSEMDPCYADTGGGECITYTGGISCRSLNGKPPSCSGSIQRCTQDSQGSTSCEEIDPGAIATEKYCYDYQVYRNWYHLDLHVLDLRYPAKPVLMPVISLPRREEAAGLLADGSDLYVSHRIPYPVSNDSRSYVRYFFRKIDLRDPSHPAIGPGINVPGELIQVDGSTVYTHDYVFGETVVESALNQLSIQGGLAVLEARRRFPDQEVHAMLLDGRGHALVTHQLSWYLAYQQPGFNWEDLVENLTVLDLQDAQLAILSEFEVDRWASLRDAREGRALFSVPGGLLLVNLEEVLAPFAQAYFPVLGWPNHLLLHGGQVTFAAGRYGMYRFPLDTYNLEPSPR